MTRGQYRHLARVEGPGPSVADGQGGFTESWVPLDPPAWWCAIASAAVRNSERVMEQTITTSASHLLTGDFHPQLSTASRLWIPDPDTGTDRRFDVVSVTRQGERRFTLLVAANEYQNLQDPRPLQEAGA
jgi:hypothetical protein